MIKSIRYHLTAPTLAYLVLAAFTIFSFSQERRHSNESRRTLAVEVHQTLLKGCARQNKLRTTIRNIILEGIPQTKQYVKDGTITQAQADRSIKLSLKAAGQVAPVNCAKVYPLARPRE